MTGHTFASTFSGFGGADLGAVAAGLRPVWGVEYDDRIAVVGRANGHPTVTGDVLTTDFGAYQTPGWFHHSPPCPSFSVAKTGGGETEADLALADAVCASIVTVGAPWLSVENVPGYEGSESLRRILAALDAAGYAHVRAVLNAADYGVPQTRKRLILVASRVARPRLPVPTHAKRPAPGLFGTLARWNGWHAAIADLLPGLPDATLAPWQMKRLPDEWRTMLVGSGGYDGPVVTAARAAPAFTVTANHNQAHLRAVLISAGNTSDAQAAPGVGDAHAGEPARAVLATAQPPRAVLVSSNTADGSGLPVRHGDRRAVAVDTKAGRVRAVLVESGQSGQVWGDGCRTPDEPCPTVTATSRPSHAPRARIARGPSVRVVQVSPRGLARFQTLPDGYRLPGDGLSGTAGLACKGIGNACPPLLMQRIYEANLPLSR